MKQCSFVWRLYYLALEYAFYRQQAAWVDIGIDRFGNAIYLDSPPNYQGVIVPAHEATIAD